MTRRALLVVVPVLRAALLVLVVALGAGIGSGCSENQAGKFDEFVQNPSSQPKFLTPLPGATGVSPVPEIHIGYEDEIDYSKATPDVVQLFDLGPTLTTPTRVAVTIAPAQDGRGFDVLPLAQLTAPRTFEVRILGRTEGLRFTKGSDVDDASFRFTTSPDPALTTPAGALPQAVRGNGYAPVLLSTTGGVAPLTFAITEGTLPPGLAVNVATGSISGAIPGTATSPQGFQFVVTLTDAIGRTGSTTYSIQVVEP